MPEVFNAEKTEQEDVIDILDPEKRKVWWQEASKRMIKEAGEFPRRELWGAYHILPGEKFVTQQQDEEIALLLRSHPITNISWILLAVVMFLVPILLFGTGILHPVSFQYRFVGILTWYLFVLTFSFEKFLQWYYSIFIVTNERIIDIDFNNIMNKQMTTANLNHVEEPEMSTRGFIKTMFQFGDVSVQTAGEVLTIEAIDVPHPQKVVDIISRLSEDLEKRRERGE